MKAVKVVKGEGSCGGALSRARRSEERQNGEGDQQRGRLKARAMSAGPINLAGQAALRAQLDVCVDDGSVGSPCEVSELATKVDRREDQTGGEHRLRELKEKCLFGPV